MFARILLVDKIKFKDESEDMVVASVAIILGSVFAIPKICPFVWDKFKIHYWNLIS